MQASQIDEPLTADDISPILARAIVRVATCRMGLFAHLRTGRNGGRYDQRMPILVEITACADTCNPEAAISVNNITLAKRLRTSAMLVKRGLQELTDAGWITRVQRRSPGDNDTFDTFFTPHAIAALGLKEPLPDEWYDGSGSPEA